MGKKLSSWEVYGKKEYEGSSVVNGLDRLRKDLRKKLLCHGECEFGNQQFGFRFCQTFVIF